MTLLKLALRDIGRNEFRSWAVFLCTALVAGLVLGTGMIARGVSDSLRLTENRLGADLLVVPSGSEEVVQSAILMGGRTSAWLPESAVESIRSIPGVAAASPQKYLMSLSGASCCSGSDLFVVAFDPETDFTVQPWLIEKLGGDLAVGSALGGRFVSEPETGGIRLYGYPLTLAGTLDLTGSNLDQSLFVTFETADDIQRVSMTEAVKPLDLPPASVSSVLVKLDAGADPNAVATAIQQAVDGVSVVSGPELFGDFKAQGAVVRQVLSVLLWATGGLAIVLMAVVFAMATHGQRRELGVWRALGATRGQLGRALVTQAALLALGGGVTGALITAYGVFLFHDYIVTKMGVPFLFPQITTLLPQVAWGLLLTVVAAIAASAGPAIRAARQDPAEAMRE